jgi:hypothetical protein
MADRRTCSRRRSRGADNPRPPAAHHKTLAPAPVPHRERRRAAHTPRPRAGADAHTRRRQVVMVVVLAALMYFPLFDMTPARRRESSLSDAAGENESFVNCNVASAVSVNVGRQSNPGVRQHAKALVPLVLVAKMGRKGFDRSHAGAPTTMRSPTEQPTPSRTRASNRNRQPCR